jgi:hypothetical protein
MKGRRRGTGDQRRRTMRVLPEFDSSSWLNRSFNSESQRMGRRNRDAGFEWQERMLTEQVSASHDPGRHPLASVAQKLEQRGCV